MSQFLRSTTSLCRICKTTIDAAIVETGGKIVMRKTCPVHGVQDVDIAADALWYRSIMEESAVMQAPTALRQAQQGCPYDCGPCTSHEQRLHLPVIPITSACNLDCPICYTHNRNEGAYHMGLGELKAILASLRNVAPEARIVNLTGGEPTQHPQFAEMVSLCHDEGVHRITISTHGLRFLKDEWLLERLGAMGARIVLSFDSFKEAANREMLGANLLDAKLRVLALLEKHDVPTTLLPVLARGQNDDETAAFVDLALSKNFIRSVEFHPMTFTGHNGAGFDKSARYTTYDALVDLEKQCAGRLRLSDFVSAPLAHPMCYQVTYLLRQDKVATTSPWLPFPRFMERQELRALLTRGLYLEAGSAEEAVLRQVIDRLWSSDDAEAEGIMLAMRGLLDDAFAAGLSPEQRMDRAERHTKAIYIHGHMDEDNFDTDRIRQCCVGMPGPDGQNIPSCAYNVLYRERDVRFTAAPKPALVQLGKGRMGKATS